jgi:hypothetical protein
MCGEKKNKDTEVDFLYAQWRKWGDRKNLCSACAEGVANTNSAIEFASRTSAFGDIDTSTDEATGSGSTNRLASRSSEAAEATRITASISGFLPVTLEITASGRSETSSHGAQSRSGIALFSWVNNTISAKMIERLSSNKGGRCRN